MAIRTTTTNRPEATLRLISPLLPPSSLRLPRIPQLPERMGTGGLNSHIRRAHPALGRRGGIVAYL
jgi:hypothetical protein